jgi:hypothetical protein
MKDYHRIHNTPGGFAQILIIAIVIITLFHPGPVRAAFIFRYHLHSEQRTASLDRIIHHQYLKPQFFKHILVTRPLNFQKDPRYKNYRAFSEDNATFPILAISAAGIELICGAILLSTLSVPAICVGFVASILAMVFGTRGLRKPKNGLAIAGLAIGILGILACTAGIILGLASLSG